MSETPKHQAPASPRPRYRWPWFVAAAALLGILLAVLWMTKEVERTRHLRQPNNRPALITNTAPAHP